MDAAVNAEPIAIDVGGRTTTALAYSADANRRTGATLVLAHGAGAGQASRFIVDFATGLTARGVDILTFNFVYTEQNRKMPDRTELLEECYRAVVDAARNYAPFAGNRLFIGGKSMGGRIASHLAASEPNKARSTRDKKIAGDNEIAGLVLLGYPLHPPGKPEQLRVAHLPAIRVPILILQGARDPFGTPEDLLRHIESLTVPVTLHVVEGGDHSLAPPKTSGVSVDQKYSEIQDVIADWIATISSRSG
jgi:hypothetical protein